ncbi:di-trans,poly-cis-decaprenylcistransferase-like protein [Leptospira santarosai str. HAI134]|nr:di-trans,poly-cis-decaprenylcistransferase-like protein [Leptospira santarosai str. HAI134]
MWSLSLVWIEEFEFITRGECGKIDFAIERTKKNKNLNVNYGSKDELLRAAQEAFLRRKKEKVSFEKPLKEKELEKFLYTSTLPPVDLLIRTAGEQRLSNFLLWQSAYAELYFTDTLWPDFDKNSLVDSLKWYETRTRKFGGLENG